MEIKGGSGSILIYMDDALHSRIKRFKEQKGSQKDSTIKESLLEHIKQDLVKSPEELFVELSKLGNYAGGKKTKTFRIHLNRDEKHLVTDFQDKFCIKRDKKNFLDFHLTEYARTLINKMLG